MKEKDTVLKELRYNFKEHTASIIVLTTVERAGEIADAVNKYFIDGSADCIGYDHQPKSYVTTFYFYVESATLLDTLVSVFDKYLSRYEQ